MSAFWGRSVIPAIAAIARDDEDPRVRKAAVAKLMRPSVLATIAREERDETVKAQALAMLRDIALEAFEEIGEADSTRRNACTSWRVGACA